jgi:hypothetical protein
LPGFTLKLWDMILNSLELSFVSPELQTDKGRGHEPWSARSAHSSPLFRNIYLTRRVE